MKILLSYPSEHELNEGRHYARVLQRLGHQVYVVNVANRWYSAPPGQFSRGYPPDITLQEILNDYPGADLFLWIEPFGLIPRGLETSPIPTAAIISDVHRNLKSRLLQARFFDLVFLRQRNYLPFFRDHPPGAVVWHPWTCNTEIVRDLHVSRDLDVAMIGKMYMASRRRLIKILSRQYRVNEMRYYPYEEIAQVYSRAKIVFNIPVGNDLNPRFFEAMACGALLLTKRAANGQEVLFQEGVHYVGFDTERELLEKIDYYLSHDEERERIARAGYEEVHKNHTLVHRVQALLETVQKGPLFGAPIRRMRQSDILSLYASFYERFGHIDALLRLAATYRSTPIKRFYFLGMGLKSFLRRAVLAW
ncbi:MAG: glycosyltransferase [Dehalococcoidia bacterium]|nr:glycosyltransferase [Dehalococcoidia bacterium]MDW8119893.1 glycosyltransferase [Chloroflexota bacterium]